MTLHSITPRIGWPQYLEICPSRASSRSTNVIGLVARKIGVDKKVAGANVPDRARLRRGFVGLSSSLRTQLVCMARKNNEAKNSDNRDGPAPAGRTPAKLFHLAPLGQPTSALYQKGIATWNTEENQAVSLL